MRLFLIVLGIAYWACATMAESFIVSSDNCALTADIEAYQAGDDVVAPDLNEWRLITDEIDPVIDIEIDRAPGDHRVFDRLPTRHLERRATYGSPTGC